MIRSMQSMIPILSIMAFTAIGAFLLIYIFVQPNNVNDIPQVIVDVPIEVTDSPQDQPDMQSQSPPVTVVSTESAGMLNIVVIAETLGLSDFQTNSNSDNTLYNPGGGGGGRRIINTDNENNTPTYTLTLLEGTSPSDGVVTMGQEVKAVATTNNLNIGEVTFRWIAPNTIVAEQTIAELHSPAEDTYAPGEPGGWTVEADFGNGVVLTENMNVPFLVLPESAIGNVVLVGSSLAALGAYYYMTKRNGLNRSPSF